MGRFKVGTWTVFQCFRVCDNAKLGGKSHETAVKEVGPSSGTSSDPCILIVHDCVRYVNQEPERENPGS